MRKTTRSLIFAALALGLAPDRSVMPATWAEANLVVPDGPKAGQKWDPSETPQLVDVLNCLAQDHPAVRVSMRKSAQVGATQIGLAWLATLMAVTPGNGGVVFPTLATSDDFIRDKVNPTVDQTPALKAVVREQRSRSGSGSTVRNKKFRGGSLLFTGANSAADLRSKTWQYTLCDEVDEWPLDLDGQGDPMEMVDARQIAFHTSGEYKKFEISTPRIKGASRIDAAFEAGDQRYWHVPCPHCGTYQRLMFQNVKFDRSWPYKAYYACEANGCVIEHHQKRAMVQAGRWVAAMPGPGRHPSFHLDAISSLLTTWDKVAEKWWAAQNDQQKLQAFFNLWLGEAFEIRGEAPEWQRLYARRADYLMGSIPLGGLVLTAAADVQKSGIYVEVVAWGAGKTSWSIWTDFLESRDTEDEQDAVWAKLHDLYKRPWRDAFGNERRIEAFAVDSGYATVAVYAWCRRRTGTLPVKGLHGFGRAPIVSGESRDVTLRGRRLRSGQKPYLVGTWDLKSELYANLRKEGRRDGAETDPPGYCYFSENHDQTYFQQLTAERLVEREEKGRMALSWRESGPNHFHDCRIYNMAAAAYLGVYRKSVEDWESLARERNIAPTARQGDLFDTVKPAVSLPPPPAEVRDDTAPPPSGGVFISGDDYAGDMEL